jgi:4-oxalocrotonate tautomerase
LHILARDTSDDEGADMPGVLLTVSGQPDQALTRRLADGLARVTCKELKKGLDHMTVMVRYSPPDQWYIAGRSLAEHGKNAFRLDVMITDETNTRGEKAAFHKAAFELLSEVLGNVHPQSNIRIVDCSPTSYGYGGLTHEFRFHRAGA